VYVYAYPYAHVFYDKCYTKGLIETWLGPTYKVRSSMFLVSEPRVVDHDEYLVQK